MMQMKKTLAGILIFLLAQTFSLTAGAAGLYVPEDSGHAPTKTERSLIAEDAQRIQLGGGYRADSFSVALIDRDRYIFALFPGESEFFTDAATVLKKQPEALSALLQVRVTETYGPRQIVAAYKVKKPLWAAQGQCLENASYGTGGGAQFVIPRSAVEGPYAYYIYADVYDVNGKTIVNRDTGLACIWRQKDLFPIPGVPDITQMPNQTAKEKAPVKKAA